MSRSPEEMSLAARLLIGGAVTGLGLAVEAVALGVIPVEPGSVHAPPWVILTAGGMFALVGLWILSAGTPMGRVLKVVVGPASLVGLLSILHWVAFGPGVRRCSGGISIPFVSAWRTAGDLQCRMAFGYGAILFDGVLASVGLSALAERHLEGLAQRIVKHISDGILLVALGPFLVILLGIVVVKAAWGRVRGSARASAGEGA